MPGMTGIEAARHLSRLEVPPAVVFTTAYDQYALQAFESQAVGYLLKPVRRERLVAALRHAARLAAPVATGLAAATQPLGERRHLAARVRDGLRLIPICEILYLRADQKYVTVRHLEGEERHRRVAAPARGGVRRGLRAHSPQPARGPRPRRGARARRGRRLPAAHAAGRRGAAREPAPAGRGAAPARRGAAQPAWNLTGRVHNTSEPASL